MIYGFFLFVSWHWVEHINILLYFHFFTFNFLIHLQFILILLWWRSNLIENLPLNPQNKEAASIFLSLIGIAIFIICQLILYIIVYFQALYSVLLFFPFLCCTTCFSSHLTKRYYFCLLIFLLTQSDYIIQIALIFNF